MSDGVPDSVIVSEFQANLTDNYATCLTTTLACYEYLILLGDEYRFIRRKWNSATWIFVANRCYNSALQGFLTAITLMPGTVAAFFSALRVFALLRRNYYIAVVVLGLGLVPMAGGFWVIAHTIYYYVSDPVLGNSCYGTFTVPPMIPFYGKQDIHDELEGVTANIKVVAATLSQTYRHVRLSYSEGIRGVSMTLLRDGSIYFITLTLLNIARLLVSAIPSWQSGNPVANITDILQPILVSRFIVNLRQADEGVNDDVAHSKSISQLATFPIFRMPTVTMDSVLGPMGEPLEYGSENTESTLAEDGGERLLEAGGGDVQEADVIPMSSLVACEPRN
ncbi:hypothetical protein NM688_g3168 [Phlebia brevispora]|uniref:Uncharacterized protein n=1 Tax=Phlebia brevispora TaxID=194682 RepID=A0ACC1T6E4_9APHY|nr:hypothetical protein NM688_g3168 [Phlebia brevispora]